MLQHRRRARIVGTKRGHNSSRLARMVDLPVNATLREERASELGQSATDRRDGWLSAGVRQWRAFEHVPEAEFAFDDGEEFIGTRVDVREEDAARAERCHGGCNAGVEQDWEFLNVSLHRLAVSASEELNRILSGLFLPPHQGLDNRY